MARLAGKTGVALVLEEPVGDVLSPAPFSARRMLYMGQVW